MKAAHLLPGHDVEGAKVAVVVSLRDSVFIHPRDVVVEPVAVWHIRELVRCQYQAGPNDHDGDGSDRRSQTA